MLRRKNSGFTLVEALVVIALSAIIGVSLFSSFSLGMKVWKRAATQNFAYRKAVLNIERLSDELRRAVDFPQVGFFGEKDSITFASSFKDNIFNISYTYNPQEKCVYRGIFSRKQMLEKEEQNISRVVMAQVKDFVLGFYGYDTVAGNYSFLEEWNYAKLGVPSAVKVSVMLENEEKLEKVITIPIAQ